ncbi:MAG: efflux RND transporter periplasmic adaptor subunit [Spirochaetaceae bacterium]|nr:efflux RND transporter periplasmic adaptor subunit [Spirochaetaceae bacterium]
MKNLIFRTSLLAGSLIFGVGACKPAAPAAVSAPGVPVFAVNTMPAAQGQIRDYLALSGDLVAGSAVDVFSDAAGKITRVDVAVGAKVQKDQAIAAVDPSKPGMNYVPATVKSPISGTVVSLPAQVGMTISQSVALARIAGGNALEIKVFVSERFISKMTLGLSCEVTLDAYPGEVFQGKITEISPTIDPASRTMEVRVSVDNSSSRLKAGMFAKVKVITEQKEGIVKIPAGALIRRFGENYIFTVEPDSRDPAFRAAKRKAVTPGIVIDGVMEVQQGLRADEEVIIRGQSLLEDGSRVNVIERAGPLE